MEAAGQESKSAAGAGALHNLAEFEGALENAATKLEPYSSIRNPLRLAERTG